MDLDASCSRSHSTRNESACRAVVLDSSARTDHCDDSQPRYMHTWIDIDRWVPKIGQEIMFPTSFPPLKAFSLRP